MKSPTKKLPPRFAQRILLWFLKEELAEEVLGDLEENFHVSLKTRSWFRSKMIYWYQILHYLRPFAIRKFKSTHPNHLSMYHNYFKIGWRNLLKNKSYSAINIGGLGIGLSCCILIGLYIWDEYSYDRFHRSYANIYRVVNQQIQADEIYNVAVSPGPLAEALKADFPEVIQTCRIGKKRWNGVLQMNGVAVEPQHVLSTDNSFFSIFDFDLRSGNPKNALLGPDEIVITETLASNLFGSNWRNADALSGIQIHWDNRLMTLAGIAKDPPANSHIQFDVLLSLKYDEQDPSSFNWDSNSYHTYILLRPNADAGKLNSKIHQYMQQYVPDRSITMSLQPLSDIYLYSDFDFQTDWSKTSDVLYVRIFVAVGLVILLIAIFNFINLATARAISRAKEVGVRKIVGAVRKQLVTQFLSESFIMTSLAVGLALIILPFFIPFLNDISGKSLAIPFKEPIVVAVIFGFTLTVTVIAGLYPAFYLSTFKPVKVLKNLVVARSSHMFRKTLVVAQFVCSIVLIIGAIVIYRQLSFLQNKNLGFDQSQLLYLSLKNDLGKKAPLLKSDLKQLNGISNVTETSSNLVDVINSTGAVKWDGQQPDDRFLMTQINADPDFVATTSMEMVAGRNFSAAVPTDSTAAYIVNETAAKRMGWTPEEALGKSLTLWQYPGTIIGVVKDFHFRPMTMPIEPFLLHYWPRESARGLLIKLKGGQISEAISSIEKMYKKYDNQTAPHYQFVNDVLESQYRAEQNTGRIIWHFSVLAILVSCLGLFGLATYAADQRTKEIGVRKVLGARVGNIVRLLSQDFVTLVVIAILIAAPIAWWSTNKWLQDFAYRISIEWWMFVLAGVSVILVALLTVSLQSIKAALTNPAKSLRTE